ncbi:hypothetical protein TNCV_2913511 [Trichonephila clavipes]|nr:hypothetical protein TNCV_2913511 [Trichonephila clavipes]
MFMGKPNGQLCHLINKEKSYRKTIPLGTRGSPSQLEDRNKEGTANRKDTLTISLKTVTKHIIINTGLHLDVTLVAKKVISQEHAKTKEQINKTHKRTSFPHQSKPKVM